MHGGDHVLAERLRAGVLVRVTTERGMSVTLFGKLVEMVSREPHIATMELQQIACRTLVLVGDDDLMTLEHTIGLFRAIPDAELAIVPGTSHFLMMEKPALVNRLILEFLEGAPSPTMMPIRRASAEA